MGDTFEQSGTVGIEYCMENRKFYLCINQVGGDETHIYMSTEQTKALSADCSNELIKAATHKAANGVT